MRKLLGFMLVLATIQGCKNETEIYQGSGYEPFFPFEPGKYLTYSLDSTVYTAFGTKKEVHTYQVKYVNDAVLTDNAGRPSMRVLVYLRKDSAEAWQPINTFMATNTGSGIEWVENNQRFIKLKNPLREGFSWKGNAYLQTTGETDAAYMADWDYTYTNVNQPLQLGTLQFDSTVTVLQRDESFGDLSNPAVYSEVNKAYETYAAGVGLVYRYFEHTIFQPTPRPAYEDGSFAIEMKLIEHN